MKLNHQTIIDGKWDNDASVAWDNYTVTPDSNAAISLDAYGVYAAEAIGDDIFIREYGTSAEISGGSIDGYGMLVQQGCARQVFVCQWSYDGSNSHLGAVSDTVNATLRLKKIGRQAP